MLLYNTQQFLIIFNKEALLTKNIVNDIGPCILFYIIINQSDKYAYAQFSEVMFENE